MIFSSLRLVGVRWVAALLSAATFVSVAAFLSVSATGCASSESSPVIASTGTCAGDKNCPLGEECANGGCAPVRAALYPNIQLASVLFRDYNSAGEVSWRGRHFDLVIGQALPKADELRVENPNIRIFEYVTNKYYIYESDGTPWATTNGHDNEDFYLHYREDVVVPDYSTTVLVPGFAPGVVPGWNPNAGPNDPPASATDRSQARVVGFADPSHAPWHMANLANPAYRGFLIFRIKKLVDGSMWNINPATGAIEGVLADNAYFVPLFNEGQLDKTQEFYRQPMDESHPYAIAFETFYSEVKQELAWQFDGNADIMPNYSNANWLSELDRFSKNIQKIVDWIYAEVWIVDKGASFPQSGSGRVVLYEKDYPKAILDVIVRSRTGIRLVLGAVDRLGGTDRGRLYTLALYYLVHNANTFYGYEAAPNHFNSNDISQWQYNPVVEVDIGVPAPITAGFADFEGRVGTSEHYELASGPDPFDSSLIYHVLARQFTNGMVLAKMLPTGSVVDSRSETMHALPEPYAVVRGDGTLGTVVTQVTLKNNEGIILVKP